MESILHAQYQFYSEYTLLEAEIMRIYDVHFEDDVLFNVDNWNTMIECGCPYPNYCVNITINCGSITSNCS